MKKTRLLTICCACLVACNSVNLNYKEGEYFLKGEVTQIESLMSKGKTIDTTVSKASVEWHLDHMLKTVNVIYDSLKNSNPTNYQSNFNFMRSVVFFTGKIPRGVAQSPQSVRPPEIITEKVIRSHLKEAIQKLNQVKSLSENAHFNHPRFGQLNRDETLHFIEIHTRHHLNIIQDILKD